MKKISILILLVCCFIFPFFVSATEEKSITLYFFHGDGCPHCAEEEKYLEKIRDKYPNLTIESYEVWYDEENAELLAKVEDAFAITRSGVPTNVIGNTVILGFGSPTGSKLERAIEE